MTGFQYFALGLALPVFGWGALRLTVSAAFNPTVGLVADGALPLLGYSLVFAATGKPVFAGSLITTFIAAFAVTDRLKRRILLEPVVFADAHQTIDILVRHPELNALFSKNCLVIWIALSVVGLLLGVFFCDPGVWPWSLWPALAAAAATAAAGWSIRGPLLAPLADIFLQAGVTADPARDTRIVGPFAMHLAYAVIARDERPRRRAAVQPAPVAATRCRCGALAPVVVVQCELFFDPRRLHPALPADLLPAFDNCRSDGIQYGRLSVPAFGANSVRTEFAVLSGLTDAAIGFDRFNPYLCFARAPVRSLAWRMRAAGYRTICVHPFDRRFYRRDKVMHNLGFDVFVSEEAFSSAARAGLYVADAEVARRIAEIVADEGPAVFVFAITMENHGPWTGVVEPFDAVSQLPEFPGRAAFGGFLRGLKSADAMLGMLTDTLQTCGERALFAFYGDHLPSLHSAFRHYGFDDRRTDYVIWSPGFSIPLTVDLTASELSRAIWDTWRGMAPARERADLFRLDHLELPILQ